MNIEQRKVSKEAAKRAIAVLGGPVKAARLLSVKGERHQTVQSWLKNRVPADYCPAIERETRRIAVERGDESLAVFCERLRPDIPWDVVREQAPPTAGEG